MKPLFSFFAFSLLGALQGAQGLSGSESYVSTARLATIASGDAQASFYGGSLCLQSFEAVRSSSESYALEAGIAGAQAELAADAPPVVFAVTPDTAATSGGETVRLFGYNLDAPGAPTLVTFADSTPLPLSPGANTFADTTVPQGTNAFGNSLGQVTVGVDNALGNTTTVDALLYTPGLAQTTPAPIGQEVRLRLHHDQPIYHQLYIGGGIDGFGLPVAPLSGALEIFTNLKNVTALSFDGDGEVTYELQLPYNPAWVGASIDLQAFVLTSIDPVAGAFTNRLELEFEALAIQP